MPGSTRCFPDADLPHTASAEGPGPVVASDPGPIAPRFPSRAPRVQLGGFVGRLAAVFRRVALLFLGVLVWSVFLLAVFFFAAVLAVVFAVALAVAVFFRMLERLGLGRALG